MLSSFLLELKRRRVARVALVYSVFAVVQAADVVRNRARELPARADAVCDRR